MEKILFDAKYHGSIDLTILMQELELETGAKKSELAPN